jgi:hypothetical protein
MKTSLKASTCAALLLGGMAAPAIATAADSPVAGRWDAVLSRNGTDIPFRLDIKGDGPSLQGVFYDGFKPYDGTTSASFQNGNLVLNVDHYLTTINAKLDNGQLNGTVSAENRETSANYTFHAVRHVETAAGPAGPRSRAPGSSRCPRPPPRARRLSASWCSRTAAKWPVRSCASTATPAATPAISRTANGCSATSTAAAPA